MSMLFNTSGAGAVAADPNMPPVPRIDLPRLLGRIAALAQVGAIDGGGCCRLALSDADGEGRRLVEGWMRELGLAVSVDAIGNVVGVRAGSEAGPPVMTGSHIDTVRTGGRYDGNLGVLAGLEVIASLNDAGIVTRRPLAVAFFTNEEGARFSPDMMGSLVYVGGMPLDEALDTVGIDGTSVRENLTRIGFDGTHAVGAPDVHAFVELHVEQGPVLEHEGVTIGAVTGVQGIHWTEFTVEGVSNHAGTTPMRMRHDAGHAAYAIAAYARDVARELGGAQLATVGHVTVSPNLVNVIPNRAVFTVDLRNTDGDALAEAVRRVFAKADAVAEAEGVRITRRSLADFAPVQFDERIVERVEALARERGHSVRRMPSGAGHDAQMLARVCPAGMIFVPSVKGLSHNVAEFTHDADIDAGANLLLALMTELAA
ncbi:N-carbamoyl-L-amino acid hydrolase [Pandoraea pnomenusa]|uniref:N-carbamoyl-L-amino acid hydrolase n=2 Tax=Burkholderiaceae TaxID=119060 RepID=A0A378YH14_9BURK|nr:N-carbamoyl-L-amino acid hydrolase [Pandoraea pnomenusa]VVE67501.1 N-carbamoyl-L-amino acid hydrolase [Pandoraea pnomenusa]